ncbi:MAG: glycosyltransferase family 4 protein [Firmicutes bacterium]|nr:glycosyltransferase family 4 protein [Bacillota bacterium]
MMSCSIPVLTSNVSSMPEVVGDAGVLVDPLSVDDITEKLKFLYYDKKLRLQCINKGLEQCELFSWKSSAEKLYKVFQEVSEI